MRSGAAAGHRGSFHETAFYGSDDDLLGIVVPFLRDGVEAGEPTYATFGECNAALVREVMGDTDGIAFVPGENQYASPAVAIRSYRELFARLVGEGAEQIRVVGEVPHPGTGVRWDGWRRYEAVVNRAYDDFPLWGMCPYDTRTTPDEVLEDVARTHPHVATPGGHHHANPRFDDPDVVLNDAPVPDPDPVERKVPDAQLLHPTPACARRAARRVSGRAGLSDADTEDLGVALSELITNAMLYGRPPIVARLWTQPGRVVATVRDGGRGIADPAIGLLPPERIDERGGLGLWIAHQLCAEVALRREPGGFTVQLAVGEPWAPPA